MSWHVSCKQALHTLRTSSAAQFDTRLASRRSRFGIHLRPGVGIDSRQAEYWSEIDLLVTLARQMHLRLSNMTNTQPSAKTITPPARSARKESANQHDRLASPMTDMNREGQLHATGM